MPQLRVHCLSMSLDGFVAGPEQSVEDPLGRGGEALHSWMFDTGFWHRAHREDGGDTGVDDAFMEASFEGLGTWIMGRNMFGPVRGPWDNTDWSGWWGDEPPYHCPVFVLTHHPRASLTMNGGTTFHFVDDPIEDVLAHAFEAAGGHDVRLGGGAAAVRQFMTAGLIDSLHLAIVPILLGGGERLFDSDADPYAAYECAEFTPSKAAAHVRLTRTKVTPPAV